MKKQLILLIFLLITFVSFGQITPISVTSPDNDTPKEAFLKVNANDAYLDTMGVQRLDSLISAGVGGAYTFSDGLTELEGNVELGGSVPANKDIFINLLAEFGPSADFNIQNSGATKFKVAGSNGSVTIGSETGLVNLLVDATNIRINGNSISDFIRLSPSTLFAGYGADRSAAYTARSFIDKGYADNNYWKTNGITTITEQTTISSDYAELLFDDMNTTLSLHAKTGGFADLYSGSVFGVYKAFYTDASNLLGKGELVITHPYVGNIMLDSASSSLIFDISNPNAADSVQFKGSGAKVFSLNDLYIYFRNLPTSNPCASRGKDAVWNDAGSLKICP